MKAVVILWSFVGSMAHALAPAPVVPDPAQLTQGMRLSQAEEGPMMCPLQEVRVARCSPVTVNAQTSDSFPLKQVLVCQNAKKEFSLAAKVTVNGELKKMGPIPASPAKNIQTGRVEFITEAGTVLSLAPDRSTADIRQCVPVPGPTDGTNTRVLCDGRAAICH